jgi:hypothetical protein
MLRESVNTSGQNYEFKAVTGMAETESDIPEAALLADFAEAVVNRDATTIDQLRAQIVERLGEAEAVDAAAIAAAFHGFVRVADSTGIPVDETRDAATAEIRAEIGIDAFEVTA